jgi:hypothetical protein
VDFDDTLVSPIAARRSVAQKVGKFERRPASHRKELRKLFVAIAAKSLGDILATELAASRV